MKCFQCSLIFMIIFLCSTLQAEPLVIGDRSKGLIVETLDSTLPDESGMVLIREMLLPTFERGAYYRPYSGGGPRGNRVEAVAFKTIAELEAYRPSATRKGHTSVQQGQFILLELKGGRYLAILPMTSEKVYGQFFVEKGKLLLKTGNFGTNAVQGKIPLLCWAYGNSPYSATQAVWEQVFESGYVAAQPRGDKGFPEEPYGYLGWCSWEHYKRNISEEVITEAVHTLEKSGAPIRWVMIDDGYLDVQGAKLRSFGVDQKKFPNGWKPIMDLKNPEKIKWIGIWRNFGGYMGGTSSAHTMDDLKPFLANTMSRGTVLPDGRPESSKAFYEKMVSDTKDNGFDFVKVDFHTRTFDHYMGTADPVGVMRLNNEALEEATHSMGIPLLNCIAQPNVNSLQTKYSMLTRSSPDYNQMDKAKNKCNTYQSFANHLWMGQTVWGDLDMFHTHDQRDVNSMAIARAISGGPIYISDEPSKVVPKVLHQLAYRDGKLLRTAAPATLLPESFFIHPFRNDEVFRVIAPMEDGVAAIALFNFTESGKALSSGFTAKDYSHAGELLQPNEGAWPVPDEGLLVYDRETKTAVDLANGFSTDVPNFDAKLLLIYPKNKGWAVIGRSDKFLPAAAIKMNSVTSSSVSFMLKESGPLLIWSEKGAPLLEGASFQSIGSNLYLAELAVEEGVREITISRK
ncbi:Raffinose synthase or seed inhibition protein Sip1 [Novipirellula aureliae]|uniref:Raffinose synthase or seed inhibition protein Sip1 n=1 Tax=Novipirellula aureliae TaxID=2527966 RepID=A0A5C6DS55_9BACT|nr:Sip1-related alpha-galactosidase [Novipirellula aureliae]TWU40153.1 Raffinose synthase or seed inhibition protein Sip1 [Novipirellula aureliae]